MGVASMSCKLSRFPTTLVWVLFGTAIPTSHFNFMQMFLTLVIITRNKAHFVRPHSFYPKMHTLTMLQFSILNSIVDVVKDFSLSESLIRRNWLLSMWPIHTWLIHVPTTKMPALTKICLQCSTSVNVSRSVLIHTWLIPMTKTPALTKICPQCSTSVNVSRSVCECGHCFNVAKQPVRKSQRIAMRTKEH